MTDVLLEWSKRRLQPVLTQLFWLGAALLLLWWTLGSVDLGGVLARLQLLEPAQLALLAVVNLAVLATFSARWWLLLLAQGYRIAYWQLVAYRLATFAVSYFTPGPHFGGEPLQVYLVATRHRVPLAAAVAAVLVDKTLEMATNFIFLTAGVLLLARQQMLGGIDPVQLLGGSLLLLALPLGLLVALFWGGQPLSALLVALDRMRGRWAARRGRTAGPLWAETRVGLAIRRSEAQSVALCRQHPRIVLLAVGASGLSWLAVAGEFWLMTRVLGLTLTWPGVVTALLASRVALLLPLPAAIGALEASQTLAMQLAGQPPAAGLTLSLLIRGRDSLLGLAGLWLVGVWVWRKK